MVEVVIALKKEQQDEEGVVDVGSGGEEEEAEKVVRRRRKSNKAACDPHKKRACVDCTKRCARIHGKVSSSPFTSTQAPRPIPAVPSFFKFMVGRFSENMDIPAPFAKTISDLAGSNIYLEDSFGFRWRVRVCLRDGGVLSFGHGWRNFVLDHAVSCGEFLVFRQIARSVFTVQMFAPSAVERLYLCERNERQSRKRKPSRQQKKPSSRGVPQTVKMSKSKRSIGLGSCCKKMRRTDDGQSDQGPVIDRKTSVLQACVDDDDSDVPDSGSQLKYSETSRKAPEAAGAAESQQVSAKAFTRDHQGSVHNEVLHGQIEMADNSTIFEGGRVEGGSLPPADVDASSEPLAMLDLNEEVNLHDMYLSADVYEFESDICNPEALSADRTKGGLISNDQSSCFNCPVGHDLSNQQHSSLGARAGQDFNVLPRIDNEQMVETSDGAANDVETNVFSANKEPSTFGGDSSSPPADECPLSSCNEDKWSRNGNVAAQKESSAIQDKQQEGQINMQGSTEQHAAETMSTSSEKPNELPRAREETDNNSGDLQTGRTESGGVLALAASSSKFCIAVPPPGQTWLELPCRLPAISRTKKQGRKVVILKDPCMRLWPVLYQCTPRFSGFITGWVDISRENRLREGDSCEFELSGNYELSFQVSSPCS